MILRLTLFLLPIIVTALFGQNATPLKAGDHAPPIIWTRILQPLTNEEPPPFLGRTTVIGFFPNVSSNASSVSRWNNLIAQFAGKSVNFVWITSESEPTLVPWLVEHPMNGWLLLDPTGETTRAYGAELSGGVIIDSNGRIAGFPSWIRTTIKSRPFWMDAPSLSTAMQPMPNWTNSSPAARSV